MKHLLVYILGNVSLYGQIVITEIMYDLPGPDSPNEFIEIFNSSDSISFDISTFEIRDKYGTDQLIPIQNSNLLPHQYGLILEGDHKLEESIYSDIIPPTASCFLVDDLSIGNGLSASDSIYILDSNGIVMDSVGWDLALPPGFSYERLNIDNYQNGSYWSASLDSLGSPGRINSNTPNSIDGSITGMFFPSGTLFDINQLVPVNVICRNVGLEPLEGRLTVYHKDQEIHNTPIFTLHRNDSIKLDFSIGPFYHGSNEILIDLGITGDGDLSNNSYTHSINVRYETGIIKLNEFLHKPGDQGFEFIEIQSCTDLPINLSGWKFQDKTKFSTPVDKNIYLFRDEYFVFGSDSIILETVDSAIVFINSIFPTLNNSGDSIFLIDPFDTVIDSLGYDLNWESEPGQSFEKVIKCSDSDNPENWNVSSAGMTPGKYNSVSPRWSDGKILIESFHNQPEYPEEFEPFSIGLDVVNAGEGPLIGKLIFKIANLPKFERHVSIPHYLDTLSCIVKIPGLSSGDNQIDIVLEVAGDTIQNNSISDTVQIRFPPGTLHINEFLPVPEDSICEFVELIADRDLNLNGWIMGDGSGSGFDLGNGFLYRGNFCLVAKDSSILGFIKNDVLTVIPENGWKNLNNINDSIWVKGPAGGGVETVLYDSSWKIQPGRSLERVTLDHSSKSASNWKPSVDIDGFTPGRENSIFLPEHNSSNYNISLQNAMVTPDGDGLLDKLIIKYQSPLPYIVLSLAIYNIEGIPVWEELPNIYLPGSGIVTWDGKDEKDRILPVGIYLIKGEIKDPAGSTKYEYFDSLVLAKSLK